MYSEKVVLLDEIDDEWRQWSNKSSGPTIETEPLVGGSILRCCIRRRGTCENGTVGTGKYPPVMYPTKKYMGIRPMMEEVCCTT